MEAQGICSQLGKKVPEKPYLPLKIDFSRYQLGTPVLLLCSPSRPAELQNFVNNEISGFI